MTITIESIDNDTFSVSINSAKDTHHTVTFSDELRESYNLGHIQKDIIIKYAFEFLLVRESNTTILSSFSVDLISNYFPEFKTRLLEYFRNTKGERKS